jgi:hypothetical protein
LGCGGLHYQALVPGSGTGVQVRLKSLPSQVVKMPPSSQTCSLRRWTCPNTLRRHMRMEIYSLPIDFRLPADVCRIWTGQD